MLVIESLRSFMFGIEYNIQIELVYTVLLSIYVAIKEVLRWAEGKDTHRLGELFFYLWFGTFIIIYGLGEIVPNLVRLPPEMARIVIQVAIIYGISVISKIIFQKKNGLLNKNQ